LVWFAAAAAIRQ